MLKYFYMQRTITKDQFWSVYNILPEPLKNAVFAEETAENIFNACVESGVEDARISSIAQQAGHVLLGVIPLREFRLVLDLDMKLDPTASESIYNKINDTVFTPVGSHLQDISSPEMKKTIEERLKNPVLPVAPEEKPKSESVAAAPDSAEENPGSGTENDSYREVI